MPASRIVVGKISRAGAIYGSERQVSAIISHLQGSCRLGGSLFRGVFQDANQFHSFNRPIAAFLCCSRASLSTFFLCRRFAPLRTSPLSLLLCIPEEETILHGNCLFLSMYGICLYFDLTHLTIVVGDVRCSKRWVLRIPTLDSHDCNAKILP
jgi:hypothetical protein